MVTTRGERNHSGCHHLDSLEFVNLVMWSCLVSIAFPKSNLDVTKACTSDLVAVKMHYILFGKQH